MCVVSYVGDQYRDDFPNRWPQFPIQPIVPWDNTPLSQRPHPFEPTQDALRECAVCGYDRGYYLHDLFETAKPSRREVSREEFNALKKEVKELRKLLLAAKEFDEATGQADCEMDEKIEFIRQLADFVGVDLDEVFGSRDE